MINVNWLRSLFAKKPSQNTGMKIVTLKRAYQDSRVTLGMLQIHGKEHSPIYTLENPWKDNKPYISCVPADEYVCERFSGKKYKDVYELKGVPGRSAILIHHGNYERNTSGCILLGLSGGMMNGEPAVKQSQSAMHYFKKLMGRDPFVLIIE